MDFQEFISQTYINNTVNQFACRWFVVVVVVVVVVVLLLLLLLLRLTGSTQANKRTVRH